jgi:hypothetical protein
MTLKSTYSDDEKYKDSTLGSVDPEIQTFCILTYFKLRKVQPMIQRSTHDNDTKYKMLSFRSTRRREVLKTLEN